MSNVSHTSLYWGDGKSKGVALTKDDRARCDALTAAGWSLPDLLRSGMDVAEAMGDSTDDLLPILRDVSKAVREALADHGILNTMDLTVTAPAPALPTVPKQVPPTVAGLRRQILAPRPTGETAPAPEALPAAAEPSRYPRKDHRAVAKRLDAEGWSLREIAAEIGVSHQQVSLLLMTEAEREAHNADRRRKRMGTTPSQAREA